MILRLTIQNVKDASGKEKRSMWATLETTTPGLERIDAAAELDECPLSKEIDDLIEGMMQAKRDSLKIKSASRLKKLTKK